MILSPETEKAHWIDALKNDVEPWELSELDDADGIKDAFTGDLSFGTGGIRCLMGIGPNRMNRLTIGKAAQGFANWLSDYRPVAIGYDTRIHSKEFAEVTACVLASNGIQSILFHEPQPTPVLDFAVRELSCSAGVCITASHNPRRYNGFKVYGPDGVQATDSMAYAIQAEISRVDPFEDVHPMALEDALRDGLVSFIGDELLDRYHDAVMAQKLGIDCSNLHVVYSPLNGTGLVQSERMLSALGVNYTIVESQSAPDGSFPNCPKPNPENPKAMEQGMAQMLTEGADLFIATDPDADRVGVACMHSGAPCLLSGNDIGLLILDYLVKNTIRKGATAPVAVTTVVTAPLADTICEANGVELRRTLTGFKYVGEQIGLIEAGGREYLLGFEESDGYLRGSYVRDKDGINGVMLVCEVAAFHKMSGRDLVEALEVIYSTYGYMLGRQLTFSFPGEAGRIAMAKLMASLRTSTPSLISNASISKTIDYLPGASMPVVCGTTDQTLQTSDVLEWRLDQGSRVLVRPSGTEPKLKCYVFAKALTEGEAETLLGKLCNDVSALIYSRIQQEGDSA